MTETATPDPDPATQTHEIVRTWTVYNHPTDYPDCWVAREWAVVGGTEPVATGSMLASPHLELVYEFLDITLGLFRLGRQPGDDPVIVGTWI